MDKTSNRRPPDGTATTTAQFTPAFPVLALYDAVVRFASRDRVWRAALLTELQPARGEVIVDIGCGTGTFLANVARATPGARLIGIDPDERVLERAMHKLAGEASDTRFYCGYLRDADRLLEGEVVAKVTSSLVLHQVPLAEKRAGLASIYNALMPGGQLVIADYGLQRTIAMRWLFKLVQCVDGFTDTQPNADGVLPKLMREAGFAHVAERNVFSTATGSISIYSGEKL